MEKQSVAERFWTKVDIQSETECWEWQAGINSTGRGIFYYKRKSIHAHRMVMILSGIDIPKGKLVLHKCDNGKCCNPMHLYIGTYTDNARDSIARGRARVLCGEDDPKSKLTQLQVDFIRKWYSPRKVSQFLFAEWFGVARTTIQNIIEKRNWKSKEAIYVKH